MKTRYINILILSFGLAALLVSCKKDVHITQGQLDTSSIEFQRLFHTPKNDQATLNAVLESPVIYFSVYYSGCFSSSQEHFILTKKSSYSVLKSDKTSKQLTLTIGEMDDLKEHLATRIGTYTEGGCTLNTGFGFATPTQSVSFGHSFCSGPEADRLDEIIHYVRLIRD